MASKEINATSATPSGVASARLWVVSGRLTLASAEFRRPLAAPSSMPRSHHSSRKYKRVANPESARKAFPRSRNISPSSKPLSTKNASVDAENAWKPVKLEETMFGMPRANAGGLHLERSLTMTSHSSRGIWSD